MKTNGFFLHSLQFLKQLFKKNRILSPKPYLKKNTFLLLEVMLSLTIAASCILPMIKTPILISKQLRSLLEKGGLQRIADLRHAEIREKLHQGEILSSHYTKKKKKGSLYDRCTVCCPVNQKKYTQETWLWTTCAKKGPHGEHYLLIRLECCYTELGKNRAPFCHFSYYLPIVSIPPHLEHSEEHVQGGG